VQSLSSHHIVASIVRQETERVRVIINARYAISAFCLLQRNYCKKLSRSREPADAMSVTELGGAVSIDRQKKSWRKVLGAETKSMLKRTIAVLAAGAAICALLAVADGPAVARGGGGHGGGGHGGGGFHGGGFHGGGMHMGGFHGGGMRMGGMHGFHGGGMHAFHGGGMHGRMAGRSFGHGGLGGLAHGRFAHGGMTHGNMAHGQVAHGIGHNGALGEHGNAGRMGENRGMNGLHGFAGHNGFGGNRMTGRAFAHNQFAARNFRGMRGFNRNGFNRNAFGNGQGWNSWGGQFWGAGWNNWGGGWGGWAGPVFWPFLYGDMFSYALWPGDYYDPFWAYGPSFILGSIFAPGPYFGADYGYGPDYYGYEGSPDVYYGSGGTPNLTRADRTALARTDAAASQSCSGLAPGVNDLPIARIRQKVHPSAEQTTLLDQLNAASVKAADVVRASCPHSIPLTPIARLDAAEKRIDAMIEAVQTVRTPLEKFYDSLSDEQKEQFNLIGSGEGQATASAANSGPAALCGQEAQDATNVPVQRIEQVVHPNAQQEQAFGDLKNAAASAAQELQSSCPTAMPQTPVARLDAAAARLKAIVSAMNIVRPKLEGFYASLSDEQKARFNTMGPPQSAAQQEQPNKTQ
jgi:hypothetical protein